ncbi:MAG: hypothetical protein ABIQ01_06940 [Pseudolysinimonas sp.]
MKRRTSPIAFLTMILLGTISGCSAGGENPADIPLPQGSEPMTLDPSAFSTVIDNAYWPMKPGTRWVYREIDGDGTEFTAVVTVTFDTRVIQGITARVIRDTVFRGDQIVEDTFDWYAQDHDGAIWYLGEQTAEFENGEVASTGGSFEAGVDGALAGIALPGDPRVGMIYRQEYLAGEAEDNGAVVSVDELVGVPAGSYRDVLMTRDTVAIEPDVAELKFYAPGIGPVLSLDTSGGSGRSELLRIETVPEGTGVGPLGQPD